MDNLCHTLTGWALAETGLKKRTPLGTAALLVAANVADVDGLAYFKGTLAALCFRRGLTHGIVATAIWPFLLVALLLGWDRRVRLRRQPGLEPARPGQLLLLSAIGVLSHPLLDLLNTYGVRLLSPFSGRWFYGDALFIVDPWMWLLLGGGAILSRRADRRSAAGSGRPARLGLGLAAAYSISMLAGERVVARRVADELASSGHPAVSVLAAPLPVTPLRRKILADLGNAYALGDWAPLSRPAISLAPGLLAKMNDPASASKAAGTEAARRFLSWSRYPVYETLPDGSVRISDLRFRVRGLTWAVLRVVPAPETGR